MELFYFSEPAPLNDFVRSAAGGAGAEFLQSWQWGEIMRAGGEEVLRVGVRRTAGGKIWAAATLIKKPLAGSYFYWFAPRGPIVDKGGAGEAYNQTLDFLFSEVKRIDRRALFMRIEPVRLPVGALSFRIKRSIDLEPRQTLILDLAKSEEELLAAMQPKTRYNLRLAEKKGVRIRAGGPADFSEFWRLMNLTGARDGFRLHGARHYQNLLRAGADFIKLFLAEYQGQNIAAGLFSFWGDKAGYLHGASDHEFRNLMAPHLLQWTAIVAAKRAGFKYYDFHGLDENKWPGVTRFKLGFGGRRVEYAGTWDVIFRPLAYQVYSFMRKIRRSLG
jgi:lipid II:glycine glycyltransferase (peptidoglycan interpeptide bridge formation enzyme)